LNYLAHLYLSGNSNGLLIGNFIADSVKGNQFQNFEEEISKGIILHRQIDSYTDQHEIVKQSIVRLRPEFKKYSGIVTDLFYDHFLAINWKLFHDIDLETFVDNTYRTLYDNYKILPDRVKIMLPYMIKGNWLLNYANFEGMQRTFDGMARRSSNPQMKKAVIELQNNYDFYLKEFLQFFPELDLFVKSKKQGFST